MPAMHIHTNNAHTHKINKSSNTVPKIKMFLHVRQEVLYGTEISSREKWTCQWQVKTSNLQFTSQPRLINSRN